MVLYNLSVAGVLVLEFGTRSANDYKNWSMLDKVMPVIDGDFFPRDSVELVDSCINFVVVVFFQLSCSGG